MLVQIVEFSNHRCKEVAVVIGNWKIQKQPGWYIKAVKKTITELADGYSEAAEWLGITQNSLFNRLRTEGDQVFPIGWAQVI